MISIETDNVCKISYSILVLLNCFFFCVNFFFFFGIQCCDCSDYFLDDYYWHGTTAGAWGSLGEDKLCIKALFTTSPYGEVVLIV